MGILGRAKDFFLPSPEVGAARRKDVFGTESKKVATVAIVGAAGAAIAAPVLLAGVSARSALSAAGGAFARSSLFTKTAVVFGAPAVVAAVIKEPKVVTRTAGGIANTQANIYEAVKDPSAQNVKDIFLENPIISTGAAAILGGGITAGAIRAGQVVQEVISDAKDNVPNIQPAAPPFPSSNSPSTPSEDVAGSSVPLTPETQVLGREVKSAQVVRRRAQRARRPAPQGNVRVNVLNQQTYIQAK